MPIYHIVLQVELSLKARNSYEALSRANHLEQGVVINAPPKARWKPGDIECVNVEQVEYVSET